MSNISIISTSQNICNIYDFIKYENNIDLSFTENFIDFITYDSINYLNFNLFKDINSENVLYIDFEKIKINSFQQYKMLLVLSASIFKSIKVDEYYLKKFNKDEMIQFIKDLYIYMNNENLKNSIEILYNNNNILIYQINHSFFLYNLSPEPKKIILPSALQNKTVYSVFCNNDKHLKNNFVFGKYYFSLFEEIN